MKLTTLELQTERAWRSATGFDQERFYRLLSHFEHCYMEPYGTTFNSRQVKSGLNYAIQHEEELLWFTWFSLTSGLPYDLLGLVSGMDASNAKRNQKLGLDILDQTLNHLGDRPKRHFAEVNDLKAYLADCKELIIDATEQNIQRPSHAEKQKQFYSGKKNPTR